MAHPTRTNPGAGFPVAGMCNVPTLHIAAAPNGSDSEVRGLLKVSGAAVEFAITADMPADMPTATQRLSPRNCTNTVATATTGACGCAGGCTGLCAGVCAETDH